MGVGQEAFDLRLVVDFETEDLFFDLLFLSVRVGEEGRVLVLALGPLVELDFEADALSRLFVEVELFLFALGKGAPTRARSSSSSRGSPGLAGGGVE